MNLIRRMTLKAEERMELLSDAGVPRIARKRRRLSHFRDPPLQQTAYC